MFLYRNQSINQSITEISIVSLFNFLLVLSDLLQRATSATSNERILKRVMSDFLQLATSATSNKRISQLVTSYFLQRGTSATSNERILLRIRSDLQRVTSNEWKVTLR